MNKQLQKCNYLNKAAHISDQKQLTDVTNVYPELKTVAYQDFLPHKKLLAKSKKSY